MTYVTEKTAQEMAWVFVGSVPSPQDRLRIEADEDTPSCWRGSSRTSSLWPTRQAAKPRTKAQSSRPHPNDGPCPLLARAPGAAGRRLDQAEDDRGLNHAFVNAVGGGIRSEDLVVEDLVDAFPDFW